MTHDERAREGVPNTGDSAQQQKASRKTIPEIYAEMAPKRAEPDPFPGFVPVEDLCVIDEAIALLNSACKLGAQSEAFDSAEVSSVIPNLVAQHLAPVCGEIARQLRDSDREICGADISVSNYVREMAREDVSAATFALVIERLLQFAYGLGFDSGFDQFESYAD